MAAPPTAQAYIAVKPPVVSSYGQMMVPTSFLSDGLGASVGPISTTADGTVVWRISYFGRVADIYPYQTAALFDNKQVTLPTPPVHVNGVLYVPWQPIADFLSIKSSLTPDPPNAITPPDHSTMLVQYPAAYIENVQHATYADHIRVVMRLSNATRIIAARKGMDVQFFLSGAKRAGVPAVLPIKDYLVPRAVTRSGNWTAELAVRINYSAPVRWFTLGSPPRLVIDLQKLFEEQTSDPLGSGLSLTKLRRGTAHGPVQMYVARIDPQQGWRLRVAPGGYNAFQRNRPSVIADRFKSLLAVNGGFFAYDGAAVGAVQVDGEWIRLPWKGRTAVGFRPDGSAKIDNLQVQAFASFQSGLRIPLHDLNGWPDKNHVTAITRRFRTSYTLHAGEIAVVVNNGAVVAKPGSGTVPVFENGFTLIAHGGAVPWLNKVARGERGALDITAPGWDGFTSALGAGPRLVREGRVDVTDVREMFRNDVRVGLGPRTALGIDAQGRYIIVVVDGRKPNYSSGLTLTEMAYTMLKLGAVDALNLDGGGSSVMAVRSRVINRPSDGYERNVSNALIVVQ